MQLKLHETGINKVSIRQVGRGRKGPAHLSQGLANCGLDKCSQRLCYFLFNYAFKKLRYLRESHEALRNKA